MEVTNMGRCTALIVTLLILETSGESQQSNQVKMMTIQDRAPIKYRDCHERWSMRKEVIPGVYTIYPNGTYPIKVYCQHSENATYTVIQRRIYGTENFARTLNDYRSGFGHPQGDYWAGLINIHHLTAIGNIALRIDMQDWSGNKRYATYNPFLVSDENNRYKLTISGFRGNVVDDMSYSNQMDFHTYDYPDPHNCAVNQRAGWWYNYCSYALLNGHYYPGGPYTPGAFYDGLYWKDWLGYAYSLKFVSMTLSK